jgi:hypothetical protein
MRARSFVLSVILLAACGRAADITGPHSAASEIGFTRIQPGSVGRSNLVNVIPGATAPSPSGLRACYSGEGNANEIVSGANGVATAGVGYVAGRFGQAFDFTALSQSVDIPSNPALNIGAGGGLTMSAWFYARGNSFGGAPGAGPIVEFDNGAHMWQHYQNGDDNGLFTNLATSNADAGPHILQFPRVAPWNQWNHAVVTYDKASGIATLYINGGVVGSANFGSYSPNTATTFRIGARNAGSFNNTPYTFNGSIDEVQLYDRALSPAEVVQLLNANGTMCVAPATQYLVVTFPSGGGESGVPFTTQPVVQLKDASGNIVSNSIAPVTATIVSGTGTLTGTTTVNAVNGVATFTNLAVAGAGNVTIGFTSGTLPAQTGSSTTSPTISTVQVARQIGITTQPGGAVSTNLLAPQPVVRILDAAGLPMAGTTNPITVAIASGTGVLSGTTTVNAVNGVAAFTDLKITGFGPYTLSFTSPGLTTATSASFNIAALPATQLGINTQPAGAESGMPLTTQPIIEIRDATGAVVPGSTQAVTATIVSTTGTLLGTTTVNAVNGVATFTDLKINGPGAASIIFSATPPSGAPAIAPVTSAPLTVIQTARALAVTQQPAIGTSGITTGTWKVEVRDAAGIKITTATTLIRAQISTGTGTLAGTTPIAAVNGVATFSDLVITGTGAFTLSFWIVDPNAYASAYVISQPLLLSAAQTVSSMAITTQPAGALSGALLSAQPVVEIRDGTGARVTSATNVVTVAIASGTGTLSGTTTATAVAGVATFSGLKITGSGAFTLKFTSPGLADLTSASFNITVPAGPAVKLGIVTQPAGAETGVPFTTQPVIEVLDANGLRVTSFSGTVTASVNSNDCSSGLLGTVTATVVNGVATFTNLKFNDAGSHQIKFSATGLTSVTSAAFTVNEVARALVITTWPRGSVRSGDQLNDEPDVEIRNAAGNRISISNASITASIASGTGGTLSGTLTEQTSRGTAEFDNLRITGAGTYTIKFTYGSLSVISPAITVTAVVQTPDHLTIVTQPAGAVSGVNFTTQPKVEVRDRSNDKVLTATTAVTVSIYSGSGTLAGTKTVNAVNGVATFTDLKITGVGNNKLRFSASNGIDSDVSNTIAVAAPPISLSWGGFFGDITTPTGLNKVKAGNNVNVEFSLGGDKGSAIFAKNYPASRTVSCSTLAATGALVALDNGDDDNDNDSHWWDDDHHHGNNDGWNSNDDDNSFSLSYSKKSGHYNFTWNTSRQYAGTCRALVLVFTDGTSKTAYFQF